MSTHPASLDESRLQAECDVRFQRRSGPGGQHRNKVETAVTLTHRATGIQGTATERRSQAENLRVALRRLRVNLALWHREAWHEPTPLWQSRCRAGRLSINVRHDDFPSLLAEALDVLATHEWELAAAAEIQGCTSSQLARLLRMEPRAWQRLNDERQRRGRRRLV